MLKTYFFIPAHSKKFLKKSLSIKSDYFIYDLEDSVPLRYKQLAMDNILNNFREGYYVRPYFSNSYDEDKLNLIKLVNLGYHIVIPKCKNLFEILSHFDKIRIVLLIESSHTLVNLKEILEAFQDKIVGLALGSQDLCNELGISHKQSILNIVRLKILSLAKAYNLDFIDTASMDTSVKSKKFKKECVNAYRLGASGKFIIHPNQLQGLNQVKYFSNKEILWAKRILENFNITENEIGAVKLDDSVFEQPHLNKLMLIKKYINERQI